MAKRQFSNNWSNSFKTSLRCNIRNIIHWGYSVHIDIMRQICDEKEETWIPEVYRSPLDDDPNCWLKRWPGTTCIYIYKPIPASLLIIIAATKQQFKYELSNISYSYIRQARNPSPPPHTPTPTPHNVPDKSIPTCNLTSARSSCLWFFTHNTLV